MDDLETLRRIAMGDAEALGSLYDRAGADAYRLARRILLSAPDAEEVVQDAFLKVWKAAGSFRGGSVRAWLARIVVNLSRDRLRRRRGPRTRALTGDVASNPGPPAGVEGALGRLPAPERTTLVMRFYEGMTYRQVARLTGVSLRTAKYRAARGLERLREVLRDDA